MPIISTTDGQLLITRPPHNKSQRYTRRKLAKWGSFNLNLSYVTPTVFYGTQKFSSKNIYGTNILSKISGESLPCQYAWKNRKTGVVCWESFTSLVTKQSQRQQNGSNKDSKGSMETFISNLLRRRALQSVTWLPSFSKWTKHYLKITDALFTCMYRPNS
jgi:hypothetical protein